MSMSLLRHGGACNDLEAEMSGLLSTTLEYAFPGGVSMYRKKYMHGCCGACLGLGMILGHCLESWLLCCGGGAVLLFMGLCWMGSR